MDIRWLEAYLVLCELRNFSRAAGARHRCVGLRADIVCSMK
ncbi:hypothetical protein [Oceanisphaera sp. KMM 10153]